MAYILSLLSLLTLVDIGSSQSIKGYGSSGGTGPTGGIGDSDRPVYQPQAYITDGKVPLAPNTTRQLSLGDPPILVSSDTTGGANGTANSTGPGNVGCNTVQRSVVIDSGPSGAKQEMLGFGMSWTDSAVDSLDSLRGDLRDQAMSDLFSQDGNNMGMMRHTIGSSDLSQNQYSFNDNGPGFNDGQPDPNLDSFDLGPYGRRMAGYISMMGKYKGDIFLVGAPWSFPGWMKNNGLFVAPNTGNHILANNSLNPHWIPQVVTYFTKYVDAYKQQYNITVNGMSPMNEPLNYRGKTQNNPQHPAEHLLTIYHRRYNLNVHGRARRRRPAATRPHGRNAQAHRQNPRLRPQH
jgi:glucan endo-1,6-beta-glucosidase